MQSPIVHCPYPHHRLVQPEGLDWSMILSTKPCLYWMTHIEVSYGGTPKFKIRPFWY
jgi:hypothetical protein